MIVAPKFYISIVFSFSWELKWPQEKLKTMLMQNFGETNKEHYGMLWYFWSGQLLETDSVIVCYYKRVFNLNGTASNPVVFMDEFPLRGKETHDSFKVVYYHLYARLPIATSPQGFSLKKTGGEKPGEEVTRIGHGSHLSPLCFPRMRHKRSQHEMIQR